LIGTFVEILNRTYVAKDKLRKVGTYKTEVMDNRQTGTPTSNPEPTVNGQTSKPAGATFVSKQRHRACTSTYTGTKRYISLLRRYPNTHNTGKTRDTKYSLLE